MMKHTLAVTAVAAVAVLGSSAGVAYALDNGHSAPHAGRHAHQQTGATTTTKTKTTTFGPSGYDGLRIGMTPAQLRAAGAHVGTPRAGVCAQLSLPGRRGEVDGMVSKKHGLAYLVTTDPNAETPEGMHVGSTRAEARAAYPDAGKAPDFFYAPVPGHPHLSYWWGYRHGRVGALSMVTNDQDCVN